MSHQQEPKRFRDGVPFKRNTLEQLREIHKYLSPDMKSKLVNQAVWDSWCRLHKETIYWGA